MMHYTLRCGAGHGFDGWFASSGAFDGQAASGQVSCPLCGDTTVERDLMTPGVPRKGAAKRPDRRNASAPATEPGMEAPARVPGAEARGAKAAAAVPDAIRGLLQRLRSEVESSCDYVGKSFAAEARRIHDGQAAPRGIYGEATAAEAAALKEDGVEVSNLPWLPRADS